MGERSATGPTCRVSPWATKILELARSYGIEASDFDEDESEHMPAPSDTYHYEARRSQSSEEACREPTVDHERTPGAELRPVGREEQRQVRDIVDVDVTALTLVDQGVEIGTERGAVLLAVTDDELGLREARENRVDPGFRPVAVRARRSWSS